MRLLKGHPFSRQQAGDCEGAAEEGVLMTQLAPEQQLAPAEVLSGEQLPIFKVSRQQGSQCLQAFETPQKTLHMPH